MRLYMPSYIDEPAAKINHSSLCVNVTKWQHLGIYVNIWGKQSIMLSLVLHLLD